MEREYGKGYDYEDNVDKGYTRFELKDLDPYEMLNIEIRLLIEEMRAEKRAREQS